MMNREGVITLLGEDWERMRAFMKDALRSDVPLLSGLNDSILSHSGKMLRPMITLLMARACNGGAASDDSVRIAAATELLHNATLMHDDVADESSQRRGAPTVVSLLGPTAAVLTGDFWLARAVDLVIGCRCRDAVIRLFSKTLVDLAEGEMLQLQKAEKGDTSEEDYLRIIYCKTASLFESAAVSAAEAVGASEDAKAAAGRYGRAMGIAFQIKDDILDYVGDGLLGKPLGVDIKEQKITLPLLGAMKDSGMEEQIRGKVCDIHSHPEYCDEIASFVIEHGGVQYAVERLGQYVAEAEEALKALPAGPEKDALVGIARYNAMRKV